MEISAFRSFRMALSMGGAAAEDAAPSAELPPAEGGDAKPRTPTDQEFVPVEEEDGDDAERSRDEMREEVICAIFDLPRSTTFYKDFSCAIAAAFPMHGRMYPTSTHVCFYSNVFGRERKILIPYESITELAKTTTLLFQSAIRIKTQSNEDYTFSSFWGTNRDRCFDLIVKIRNQVLGLSEGEAVDASTDSSTSPTATETVAAQDDDEQQQRLRRTVSDGGIVAVPRDTTMELLVEEKFPVSVDEFLANFIADDAPFGQVQYNERIGTTEIQCNPWSARSEDESLGETRSMQFRVPIDSPIGPNSSIVDVLQCHKTNDRGLHTIETSTRLVDIPYGDYFSVEDRWTLVSHPRSPNECSLTIELKVVFSKSTFWKGQIESRALADNKTKWQKWVEMAKEHLRAQASGEASVRVASPPNSRASSTGSPPSSNGTPLHAAPSCPRRSPPARRPTGVVVESRAVDSIRDRSRASPRAEKSHRRVSAQAIPWIIIVILIWIIIRLNGTLSRMEQAMVSTELRVAEIQQQITLLHTARDVCR